jgi:hypothetical protein
MFPAIVGLYTGAKNMIYQQTRDDDVANAGGF